MIYLQVENTNDDDVTLFKFGSLLEAAIYLLRNDNLGDFVMTDMVEQAGMVIGFPQDDYTLVNDSGEEL